MRLARSVAALAATAAFTLVGCSSSSTTTTASTATGGTTASTAAGGTSGSSAAGGNTGSKTGGGACDVLTTAEFKQATGIEVTVASERRGQDTNCAFTSASGSPIGELVVTQPSVVKPVLGSTSATKKLDGIGDGAALATDLQGYLIVGQNGYVWTTMSAKDVTGAQVEALLKAIAAT